jgi:tape measure domain-containing protein
VLRSIETPQERQAAALARINALFQAGALNASQYHRAIAAGEADLRAAATAGGGLAGALGLGVQALVGFEAASRLLDLGKTAAALQDLETRLRGITERTGDYAGAEAFLISISERHHKTISSLADGYVKLLGLEDAGVLTRQEVEQATAGLSNEQSRLGASSEQLSQVMLGLGQALSAPIVQFDELHQITDPLPGLMGRMERALGLTTGAFKDLANGAGLSRDLIKRGFLLAVQESEGAAERAGGNISASLRDVQREWELLAKSAERPVQLVVDAVATPAAMALKGWRLIFEQIDQATAESRARIDQAAADRALVEPHGWDAQIDVQGRSLEQLQAMHDALVRLRGQYGAATDLARMYGRQLQAVDAAMEQAGARAAPALAQQSARASTDVAAMIKAASEQTGVSEALIRAVATAESSMQQLDAKGGLLKSPKGAMGTMQLMPETAARYRADPADQAQNILGGAKYLADLLKQYAAKYKDGETALTAAIAAYNLGEAGLAKRGLSNLPEETEKYVKRVQGLLAGSDLAGKFVDPKEYAQNLKESEAEFKASLDRNVGAAENAAKRVAAQGGTASAALDAEMAKRQQERQAGLAGLAGEELKAAQRANEQAALKDAEEFARRRAEIEQQAVAAAIQAQQARVAALKSERAEMDRFESSAADKLAQDGKIKDAEAELAVLAEQRRQAELKASDDIIKAQTAEAAAYQKSRAEREAGLQSLAAAADAAQAKLAAAQGAVAAGQGEAGARAAVQATQQRLELEGKIADARAKYTGDRAAQDQAESYLRAQAGASAQLDLMFQQSADRQTSYWQGAWEQAGRNVHDALSNLFEGLLTGQTGSLQSLLQSFRQSTARIAANFAATAVEQALAGLFGLPSGGRAATATASLHAGAAALAGPGAASAGAATGTASRPFTVNLSGGSVSALSQDWQSAWDTVSGWFSSAPDAATVQAQNSAAFASGDFTGYNPAEGTATAGEAFGGAGLGGTGTGTDWSGLASAIAPIAAGSLAQALTANVKFAPWMADEGLLELHKIAGQIGDIVGNIPGWTMLAKFLGPAINSQDKWFQQQFPDRKYTWGSWIGGQSIAALLGVPFLAPLFSGWLAPIVKSAAGFQWNDSRGLELKGSYAQNGAPVDALVAGGQGLSHSLLKAQDILGVSLGDFSVELRNRGERFWLNAYDPKGENVAAIGGDKGIRLTDINLEGQLKLLETALLKRQEVLQQFDDYLMRSAIRAGGNLTEISDNLAKVQKLRLYEGEATALSGQLTKQRSQYADRQRLIDEYARPVDRLGEQKKLDAAYQRQFDAQVGSYRNALSSLAGGPSSTLADSIRAINDQAQQLKAQNKELEDAAKKSKGKLQYAPAGAAEIEAARQAGVAAQIREVLGIGKPLSERLADLKQQFQGLEGEAARAGISIDQFIAAAAQAYETLRTSLVQPAREQLAADIQGALDNIAGPDATAKRLGDSIAAGLAGLDQIADPAQLETAVNRIVGLVQRRSQIEIGLIQDQISAAENLKGVVAGLKASDLSPEAPSERLAAQKAAFESDVAKFNAGDHSADLMARIGQEGQAYLQTARDFWAGVGDYPAIYSQVIPLLEEAAQAAASPADPINAAGDEAAAVLDQLQNIVQTPATPASIAAAGPSQQALADASTFGALLDQMLRNNKFGKAEDKQLDGWLSRLDIGGYTADDWQPWQPQAARLHADAASFRAAHKYAQATRLDDLAGWINNKLPTDIKAFARGGLASGLALVGEEGPELARFTAPARIYTAGQTREILSGGPPPGDADAAAQQFVAAQKALLELLGRLLEAAQQQGDIVRRVGDQITGNASANARALATGAGANASALAGEIRGLKAQAVLK